MLTSLNIDIAELNQYEMQKVTGGDQGNNVIAPDDEDQKDHPLFPTIWY